MSLGTRLPATIVATIVLASSLAACQDDQPDDPHDADRTIGPEASPAAALPTPADGSLYAPGDIDDGLTPWIGDATDDLASRLQVGPDAIAPIAAVLVTWPDAALGCPEPGRQYATVATDGALIELLATGSVYRYHAGGDRGPFLCPRPIDTRPAPGR